MIPEAQTSTWTLDAYTIRQEPLIDNRAWSVFIIFLKDKLIGRQISYPSVSDCRFYELRRGVYAHEHESHRHSGGYVIRRRGKAKNASLLAVEPE